MRSAVSLSALLLLGAAPALASGSFTDSEGITYPDVQLGVAVDCGPIVTPDVSYEGPHATQLKPTSLASFRIAEEGPAESSTPSALPLKPDPKRSMPADGLVAHCAPPRG